MNNVLNNKVIYIEENELQKYDIVINSAMFEHVTKREQLEHINSLVKDDGVLIVHTVVRENIPKNPNWFYIQPVHCSFHTNTSMQILMNDWGYKQSLYSPTAKCWILFKEKNHNITKNNLKNYTNILNNKMQTKYFFYKDGFMDYWID